MQHDPLLFIQPLFEHAPYGLTKLYEFNTVQYVTCGEKDCHSTKVIHDRQKLQVVLSISTLSRTGDVFTNLQDMVSEYEAEEKDADYLCRTCNKVGSYINNICTVC